MTQYVIARSETIPRLSLRGWQSQPKQSRRLGTGSAISGDGSEIAALPLVARNDQEKPLLKVDEE